ncbi:hypothetical protein [Ferrimonas kyonanensis]|uniref:hypothetical protein n=1 Tax=Ferrimonas kyonanensis TaxID=364763 RepID=UPI0012EC5ACD|nr:hypothetical protein [Ferrimonas kyonanensis]
MYELVTLGHAPTIEMLRHTQAADCQSLKPHAVRAQVHWDRSRLIAGVGNNHRFPATQAPHNAPLMNRLHDLQPMLVDLLNSALQYNLREDDIVALDVAHHSAMLLFYRCLRLRLKPRSGDAVTVKLYLEPHQDKISPHTHLIDAPRERKQLKSTERRLCELAVPKIMGADNGAGGCYLYDQVTGELSTLSHTLPCRRSMQLKELAAMESLTPCVASSLWSQRHPNEINHIMQVMLLPIFSRVTQQQNEIINRCVDDMEISIAPAVLEASDGMEFRLPGNTEEKVLLSLLYLSSQDGGGHLSPASEQQPKLGVSFTAAEVLKTIKSLFGVTLSLAQVKLALETLSKSTLELRPHGQKLGKRDTYLNGFIFDERSKDDRELRYQAYFHIAI